MQDPTSRELSTSEFVSGPDLAQPAVEWFDELPRTVPQLKERFRDVLQPAARISAAAESVGKLGDEGAVRLPEVEVKDNRVTTTVVTWTGSVLVGAAETIALVFLILASGSTMTQKMVEMMPTLSRKKQAVEIAREVQQSVSLYLFTVGVVNCLFGALLALVFHLVGLPNAILWGALVALLNFVPYFGPVVGVALLALSGLTSFDSLGSGLLPAGLYLALHLVEANAVTPMILGRRFTLHPVVVFVALIFFTWLWGVLGALLAVPILVVLKIGLDKTPFFGPPAGVVAPGR